MNHHSSQRAVDKSKANLLASEIRDLTIKLHGKQVELYMVTGNREKAEAARQKMYMAIQYRQACESSQS